MKVVFQNAICHSQNFSVWLSCIPEILQTNTNRMQTIRTPFYSAIADLAVLDGFAGIVENSSDAILTRDADKKITSWNKGAELLLGYKREEAIGKTAQELGMIRFTPGEMKELDEALEKSGVWKAEKEYYHRDGNRLYGSVSANVMKDETGQIGSVVLSSATSPFRPNWKTSSSNTMKRWNSG